jgi:hypothetical protein
MNLSQVEGINESLNHVTGLVEKKAQKRHLQGFFGFSDHGRDPDCVRLGRLGAL